MRMLIGLLILLTAPAMADDVSFGAAYGSSHNADGAVIATGQYNAKHWYAGGMYFLDDPNGSKSTITTCETQTIASHRRHDEDDRPPPTTQTVCTDSHNQSDTNVNAGLYAGWRAVQLGNFDAGIGVIAFDKSDVMTDGHSTVHAMANYRMGPVVFSYQYAGGSFFGAGFNFPLGKTPETWTVERVK